MNDRLQVLVVVGTRPEAIKLLPVIQRLRESQRLQPVVVATGQHRDMVNAVLALDHITPDIDLTTRRSGRTLNELFAGVLVGMEEALVERFGPPDVPLLQSAIEAGGYPAGCLVHGDTTSAMAAALACFHLGIPVAHVEAGLRTRDPRSPFPEELNRQMIARVAAFHLSPTATNAENLILERIRSEQIFVTGNTGIDAMQWVSRLEGPIGVPEVDVLPASTRVVVVTAHRRENWGSGLVNIGTATARLAVANPDLVFVVPLHPNPLVDSGLRPVLRSLPNVVLTPALDYRPFAKLLARAYLAISDSGGVQEEAPSVGTPVLVTRDTTERQEGVAAGTLRLVGTDPDAIVAKAQALIDDPLAYLEMTAASNPYGDGQAARRIVQAFEHLAFGARPPSPFGVGFGRSRVLSAAGYQLDLLGATQPRPGRGRVPRVEPELLDLAEAPA